MPPGRAAGVWRIGRSPDAYAADNDGLLPEYGTDLAAAMAPYLPWRDYRCRLVPPRSAPSFTVAPGPSRALASDSRGDPEAPYSSRRHSGTSSGETR